MYIYLIQFKSNSDQLNVFMYMIIVAVKTQIGISKPVSNNETTFQMSVKN